MYMSVHSAFNLHPQATFCNVAIYENFSKMKYKCILSFLAFFTLTLAPQLQTKRKSDRGKFVHLTNKICSFICTFMHSCIQFIQSYSDGCPENYAHNTPLKLFKRKLAIWKTVKAGVRSLLLEGTKSFGTWRDASIEFLPPTTQQQATDDHSSLMPPGRRQMIMIMLNRERERTAKRRVFTVMATFCWCVRLLA